MVAQTFPATIPAHVESGGLDKKFKNLEAAFGDGFIQVTGDGINSNREVWSLTWANEDAPDVTTIKNFLDDHAGRTPFNWTPPGQAQALYYNPGGYIESNIRANSSNLTAAFIRWYGADPV